LQLIKYLPELLEPLFFMLDDTRKEEFFFSLPLSFYYFTYSFLSTWIKMRLAISVEKAYATNLLFLISFIYTYFCSAFQLLVVLQEFLGLPVDHGK
jgi:hypothetical protein